MLKYHFQNKKLTIFLGITLDNYYTAIRLKRTFIFYICSNNDNTEQWQIRKNNTLCTQQYTRTNEQHAAFHYGIVTVSMIISKILNSFFGFIHPCGNYSLTGFRQKPIRVISLDYGHLAKQLDLNGSLSISSTRSDFRNIVKFAT